MNAMSLTKFTNKIIMKMTITVVEMVVIVLVVIAI